MVEDHDLLPAILSRNGTTPVIPGLQTIHAYLEADEDANHILAASLASLISPQLQSLCLELEPLTLEPTFLAYVIEALIPTQSTLKTLRIDWNVDDSSYPRTADVAVLGVKMVEWLGCATALAEISLPGLLQSREVLQAIGRLPRLSGLGLARCTKESLFLDPGLPTNSSSALYEISSLL